MLILILWGVLVLALSAAIPYGVARRVLCPASAGLGLAAGLAWSLVIAILIR